MTSSMLSVYALNYSRRVARALFKKRGDNTEVHITEAELAALMARAFDAGITELAGRF